MKDVFTAIKERYDSDAGAEAQRMLPGGLWLMHAAQDMSMSYGVMFPVAGTVEGSMDGLDIDRLLVQFSFWVDADNMDAAFDVLAAWRRLYDNTRLQLSPETLADASGWRMIAMRRTTPGRITEDPDGGYVLHVDYEVMYCAGIGASEESEMEEEE